MLPVAIGQEEGTFSTEEVPVQFQTARPGCERRPSEFEVLLAQQFFWGGGVKFILNTFGDDLDSNLLDSPSSLCCVGSRSNLRGLFTRLLKYLMAAALR